MTKKPTKFSTKVGLDVREWLHKAGVAFCKGDMDSHDEYMDKAAKAFNALNKHDRHKYEKRWFNSSRISGG